MHSEHAHYGQLISRCSFS